MQIVLAIILNRKKLLCAIGLLVLVVGCVQAPSVKEDEPLEAGALTALYGYEFVEEVKEISNYDIHGWQYLSAQVLVIPARPSSKYLLYLDRPCTGLSYTEVIGFTSTVGRLRVPFDAVVVPEQLGGGVNRCYIKNIFRVKKHKSDEAEK